MENENYKKNISLSRYLLYENDKSKILEMIYQLDKQLKFLHSKHFYVQNLNAEAILYNEDETFSFSSIIRNSYDEEKNIKNNILKFTQLSLGIYAFVSFPQNVFTDYSKLDEEFIYNNYLMIREFVPYAADYYDSIIIDKRYSYYSDYIDRMKERESSSNKRGNSLIKATTAGKLYSDDSNNKAAFSNVAFYPLILFMFVLFSIISYFVFNFLRG